MAKKSNIANPYGDLLRGQSRGGLSLNATGRSNRGGGARVLNNLIGRSGYVPVRTGRRPGGQVNTKAYPDPPLSWGGTLPEWAIFWAFTAIGMKEHQDFEYQYYTPATPNGVDFYYYPTNLIIEIYGIYWHYQQGKGKVESDLEREVRLQSMGYEYCVIDEDDALSEPIHILREALAGRDHSRLARGLA